MIWAMFGFFLLIGVNLMVADPANPVMVVAGVMVVVMSLIAIFFGYRVFTGKMHFVRGDFSDQTR
jgi:hypothetical protein